MCYQTHGHSHLTKHFQDWCHHHYIFCLFSFLSTLFYFTFYYLFLFWRHVECACVLCFGLMFRLVVSGPVSLSLSTFFAALILGFVCSIWAKFSNGDNYRGRPGERRRWVLPFLLSELHASPSQSTTSPSIPPLSILISVTVCVIRDPVKHWVCCLTTLPFIVTVLLSQTNCYFTSRYDSFYLLNQPYHKGVSKDLWEEVCQDTK